MCTLWHPTVLPKYYSLRLFVLFPFLCSPQSFHIQRQRASCRRDSQHERWHSINGHWFPPLWGSTKTMTAATDINKVWPAAIAAAGTYKKKSIFSLFLQQRIIIQGLQGLCSEEVRMPSLGFSVMSINPWWSAEPRPGDVSPTPSSV